MSGAISATAVTAATAAGASAATAATAGTVASGLAAAATVGSAVIGGVGAYQQGQAASAAAGYNAQVAENNAKIATQNANLAGATGEANVGAAGAKTRAGVGATIASQGAAGIDVNSGSAVDTRESESKIGMLNALNIRSQAAQSAYGFQTQSASDTGQAALDRSQASSENTASYINAGSTVLGGIGKAAAFSDWLNSSGPVPLTETDTTQGGTNYTNSFGPVNP